MIQIDIEMPKCCDVCMFSQWSNLSQTASCKLKDYEPCFDDFSKEYKSKRASFCPLHEVTNTDTVSRQAVLDAIFSEPLYESGMRKRDSDDIVPAIYEKIKALPPSPSRQTEQQIHCNKCKHYQGVHGVQGHAPCSYWKSGGVLWNWYCSQAEPYRP